MIRKWLDERMLRLAYWLLWKVRQGDHSGDFQDRINDAQREIAEVVTTYYARN